MEKLFTSTRIRLSVLMTGILIGFLLNFCKYNHILPPTIHEIVEYVKNDYYNSFR